jgi:hypothetical protein
MIYPMSPATVPIAPEIRVAVNIDIARIDAISRQIAPVDPIAAGGELARPVVGREPVAACATRPLARPAGRSQATTGATPTSGKLRRTAQTGRSTRPDAAATKAATTAAVDAAATAAADAAATAAADATTTSTTTTTTASAAKTWIGRNRCDCQNERDRNP